MCTENVPPGNSSPLWLEQASHSSWTDIDFLLHRSGSTGHWISRLPTDRQLKSKSHIHSTPLPPFPVYLPSKNYFLYLGHYSGECCTVSPESHPPDSLYHRHRVSAWSLFLHHSSGNTQTRISSLPRNQELDLLIYMNLMSSWRI